jgi:membrane protease YdiL (CAAX protease family)
LSFAISQYRAQVQMAATLAAFVVLWLALDRSAAWLGSYRGEAGLSVCAITLAAAIAAEFALSRRGPFAALTELGLRAPRLDALGWTLVLCAALLAFYPAYSLATRTGIALRPDWLLLAIGLFAQGGVAEEVVFRGFLFRRFREGRSFWRATLLASAPFIAVHALMFFTMDWPIALASLLLAVSISFPLAWLFERSGGSVWTCALVHAVVQGSIKLVVVDDAAFTTMAVVWMAASGVAPWLLFFLRPKTPRGRPG